MPQGIVERERNSGLGIRWLNAGSSGPPAVWPTFPHQLSFPRYGTILPPVPINPLFPQTLLAHLCRFHLCSWRVKSALKYMIKVTKSNEMRSIGFNPLTPPLLHFPLSAFLALCFGQSLNLSELASPGTFNDTLSLKVLCKHRKHPRSCCNFYCTTKS